MKEVCFQFRHDGCWLQDTTERLPGLTLVSTSLYLSGDHIVIGLTAHASDPAVIEEAFASWKANPRIHKITRIHDGPRGTRFHAAYDKAGSIYPNIIEHTPVSIGAIRFRDGQEFYQIFGEGEDVSAILRTMGAHGDLRIGSVRDVEDLEAEPSAMPELTDKQVEAILTAHQAGYYQWPRKKTASQLARSLGLSSSAFLDHLRTAEARLMDAQIEALLTREPERRLRRSTRPPKDAPDRR